MAAIEPLSTASDDAATVGGPAAASSSWRAPSSLFNRDFVLLWQGQLVSNLGNQAFLVATMFWTMSATGSATVMGALLMSATLPPIVLGPIAGVVADRHSRRAIIVACDGLRGVTGLLFVALLYTPGVPVRLQLLALFAVAAIGGMINALFQPTVAAAVPDLVPPERLAAANSLNQLSMQGAALTGQALGGVLFRVLGAPLLFLVDAVSFLISAVTQLFIRLPHVMAPRAAAGSAELGAALRDYAAETLQGVRFVWDRRGMRLFLVAASAVNLFFMPVFVLLPFYVTGVLARSVEWYGFLLAALSAGSLLGVVAAGIVPTSIAARLLLPTAFVGAPVAFGALGVVAHPGTALALCATIGVAVGLINVFVFTLVQRGCAPAMRGRVLAVTISVSGAATPLGMALGGVLGDLTGKNVPLIYAVSGALATVAAAIVVLSRSARGFLLGREADHSPAAAA